MIEADPADHGHQQGPGHRDADRGRQLRDDADRRQGPRLRHRRREHRRREEQEIGLIAVDSIYSPVTRVRYATEDARVGQKTDYDRLILEIWTNGTITPEMALVEASQDPPQAPQPVRAVLRAGLAISPATKRSARCAKRNRAHDRSRASAEAEHDRAGTGSVASGPTTAWSRPRSQTVRELVKKTEADLLKVRSFGKTSLREVKRKLADLGLSLGMDLDSPMAAAPQPATMPTTESRRRRRPSSR